MQMWVTLRALPGEEQLCRLSPELTELVAAETSSPLQSPSSLSWWQIGHGVADNVINDQIKSTICCINISSSSDVRWKSSNVKSGNWAQNRISGDFSETLQTDRLFINVEMSSMMIQCHTPVLSFACTAHASWMKASWGRTLWISGWVGSWLVLSLVGCFALTSGQEMTPNTHPPSAIHANPQFWSPSTLF